MTRTVAELRAGEFGVALVCGVLACGVLACGGAAGGGGDQECRPGQSGACACDSGSIGTQQCNTAGRWTACGCGKADPGPDGASPDHGEPDAAEATDAPEVAQTDAADAAGEGGATCTGPMAWTCASGDVREICMGGLLRTETCPDGTGCVDGWCVQQECSPGETDCTGPDTFHRCNEDGTGWLPDQQCVASGGIKTYCDIAAKKCVCELPVHVLFVVDASGSMQLEEVSPGVTQWDVALQAISEIMKAYPFLAFGLATFPNQMVDCGVGTCVGNGGCGYVQGVNIDLSQGQVEEIDDYLAARKLSKDQGNLEYVLTPLLGMFDYLVEGYPADGPLKAHPFPAYVVLLSDGQDSCYNPIHPDTTVGPLAARAAQLLDQHKVKTFAIGFNLANGQDQLDAIAMHGGTGHAKYVPANDLGSLLAAFQAIFEAMQSRTCEDWTDEPHPPDCPDTDADGWCEALDCDDGDAAVMPGAAEAGGNGRDDDCDGQTDEPPMDQADQDGDGFTPAGGDCDDFHAQVGPGAFEVPLDGLDNDCDGKKDETACDCTPPTGGTLEALACAAELSCYPSMFLSQGIGSPLGDDLTGAWVAKSHFGKTTNDLAPRAGASYALLATGPANGTAHSTDMPGNPPEGGTDPYSNSDPIFDAIEWSVTLTAPWNAQGFAIDYVFFSEEYDDYVGTIFNDKFYMLLNGPTTTGGQTKVVNFTDCRDPSEYHDLSGADCPLASGYCCYIAINTALSECCWYDGCKKGKWKTDISGTGFECANSEMGDSDAKGSSTGWLKTQSPVAPGETFTLTFHLHDTGDGVYDSAVILDNFRWLETPTTPGTEPVN